MEQLVLFQNNELQMPQVSNNDIKKVLEENAHYGLQSFYNVSQTAGLLALSYKKVIDLVLSCKLDCLQIRGTYRIPWWAILEYLGDVERIENIEKDYYHLMRVQETAYSRQKRG